MSKDSPTSDITFGVLAVIFAAILGGGFVHAIPAILAGGFALWVAVPFFKGLRI